MVFYLTGDSVLQKKLFIKQFLNTHPGYEYKKIFSDSTNKIQELRNASESLGLFSDKKIYEIVDFDEWNEADKKEFLKIAFPKNESLIIFVIIENIDNNIKKNENFEDAKVINFEKPKEWNEKNWIDFILNTAKALDLNITEENALLIFQLVGPDELAISSELEKIKLISDNKKQISNEDIQSIIYKRVISKLSEFSFSVSELQFEKAKSLISEIFSEYDNIAIVYSLSKHFIDLLNILTHVEYENNYEWPKVSETAKKMSMPTPIVGRFLGFKFKNSKYTPVNHLSIYNPGKVRKILLKLYKIDREVKEGGNAKLLVLELLDFIEKLCKHSNSRKLYID